MTAVHGDVAGYRRLTADNQIETCEAPARCAGSPRKEIASAGGEVVQFVGDESMAIVPGDAEALLAAGQRVGVLGVVDGLFHR